MMIFLPILSYHNMVYIIVANLCLEKKKQIPPRNSERFINQSFFRYMTNNHMRYDILQYVLKTCLHLLMNHFDEINIISSAAD